MSKTQIQKVKDDLNFVDDLFRKLIENLAGFEIASEAALPFGLKEHTRSVSWIAEQVVTQNLAKIKSELGLKKVEYHLKDTSLHDCEVRTAANTFYINVKMHNMEGGDDRNDIAAAQKLLTAYKSKPAFNLIYCCVGIRFKGCKVSFDSSYMKVFSAQFLPSGIYINPANAKLQATYSHKSEIRSRKDFIKLLESKVAKLPKPKK